MSRLSATQSSPSRTLAFVLLCLATAVSIAGTDLVLPAIPSLPDVLGGSASSAQFVLAAYVAGTGVGLLAFGALGNRFELRKLLIAALAAFALLSFACMQAGSMAMLIGLRFLQGTVSAAAAVFAPAIFRQLYGEAGAVRAIGVHGSIEALVPGLAPILGAWLVLRYGWGATFGMTGLLAAMLALMIAVRPRIFPPTRSAPRSGSYAALLRNPTFLRYALSHALVLGGLLVFVFGAPTVIVRSLDGTLSDFIRMQVVGITLFIIAVNLSGWLSQRWGAERLVTGGSILAALASAGLVAYALAGGRDPMMLAVMFVPMNVGLGLRGPPGFLRAILAARGDDTRGSALAILAILGAAAGGTALVAPFITAGLIAISGAALLMQLLAILLLIWLPSLEAEPPGVAGAAEKLADRRTKPPVL